MAGDEARALTRAAVAPEGATQVSVLEAFDGESPMAVLPEANTSFGAAEADGKLWLYGGYHGVPHHYSKEGQSAALFRFDPEVGEWARLDATGELATGLQSVTLDAVGDELIAVGGMQAMNGDGEAADLRSVDRVAAFDPDTQSWTQLPALPAPRSSHDAVAIGERLYVVGGWALGADSSDGSGTGRGGTWASTMAVLDTSGERPTWTELEQPFQRRALATAAVGNKLYAVGGMGPDGMSNRVEVYDIEANSWSEGPAFPGFAFGLDAIAYRGKLFAVGLEGKVYRLDEAGQRWEHVDDTLFGRIFHRLAVVNDQLMVIGGVHGMTTDDRIRHIEVIDGKKADRNEPQIHRWSFANPGAAKNRQGVLLADDRLVFAGGNVSLGQHDFKPQHFTDEMWQLHLTSLRWEALDAFPVKRQSLEAVAVGEGKWLWLGGFGHPSQGRGDAAVTHRQVFAYDVNSHQIEERASLPDTRSQFAVEKVDDSLFIFGGLDFDPTRGPKKMFDHHTTGWKLPADVPKAGEAWKGETFKLDRPRRAFGSAGVGDFYYLISGMEDGFKLIEDCKRFEYATQKWKTMSCPDTPRLNPETVRIGDELFIIGGSSPAPVKEGEKPKLDVNRSVEVYDTKTDTWSTLMDDIGMEPKHIRAFAWQSKLLLVSTHNEEGRTHLAIIDLGLPPAAPTLGRK